MGNTSPNRKYLIGNYLCLLYLIYVCLSILVRSESIFSLTSKRLLKDIPDPFFGPKGIRHLLVLRGFSGYVITSTYFCACRFHSFNIHYTVSLDFSVYITPSNIFLYPMQPFSLFSFPLRLHLLVISSSARYFTDAKRLLVSSV